jgi:hypothetical protein
VSNLAFSRTNPTDTPSIALDRIEVAIHKAVEQHPTGRTSNDDSSTIISISERMPYFIDDLSELSFTLESTYPVSPSPRSPSIPHLAPLGSH